MVNKFLLNKRVRIDGGEGFVCVKVEVKLKEVSTQMTRKDGDKSE
jgi:hypothetical protein